MPYPWALALTLLVEVPLVVVGLSLLDPAGSERRTGRVLVAAVLVNLVSHPLLWLALVGNQRGPVGGLVALGVGEVLVAVVEGFGLWLLTGRRHRPGAVLLLSGCANAVSLAIGLAVGLALAG